jgi:hypothetical protein
MGIKEIQVFDDSSDEKWDDDFEVYLNPERAEVGIVVARVKSAREKDSGMLPSSAMRMMKKKVEFEKKIVASKISRFGEYI